MNKFELFAIKAIRILTYISLFLPLFVYKGFYYPFTLPRTAVFCIFVEVMVVLFVYLVLKRKEFRPKITLLTVSIGVFIIWLFIASIFGVNFNMSFWGSFQRSDGIFRLLHYFVFFIIISSIFKEKKDWLKIFNFVSLVGFLISIYAIGQRFGSSLVYESGVDRATGTIGNAGFLATFILFIIFINGILFLNKFKPKINLENQPNFYSLVFYIFNIIINIIVLMLANTRGAILAFGFGLMILLLYFAFRAPNIKIRKISIGVIVLLVFVTIFIFIFRDTNFIKQNDVLRRLSNLYDTTAKQRLFAWKLSWQGFLERPFLGFGYGNYSYVYNKHFTEEYLKIVPSGSNWFDRAHNIILEILTNAGIVGVLFYLLILISVFLVIRRLKVNGIISNFEALFLDLLFIVYFLQNLFIFDMFNSYLILFLIFGYLNSWQFFKMNNQNNKIFKVNFGFFKKLILIIIVVLIANLINLNIKSLMSSYYGAKAYGMSVNKFKNVSFIMENYKNMAELNAIGDSDVKREMAFYLVKLFDMIGDGSKLDEKSKKQMDFWINFTIQKMREEMKEQNYFDVRDNALMARLLQKTASYYPDKKQDYLKESDDYLKMALDLGPNKIYIYNLMIQNRILAEDYKHAAIIGKKALNVNSEDGSIYFLMAIANWMENNKIEARDYLKKSIYYKIKFEGINDVKFAMQMLDKSKDFEDWIYLYNELARLDPEDPQNYASLAYLYMQIGEYEKAKEAISKAWVLNPLAEKEVKRILKIIEEKEKTAH